MSDSAHEEAHTGPIQTPKQLFWVSMAAFIVPVLIIIGLVAYVVSANRTAPGATDNAQAVAMRLQKVGMVEIRDANRPLATGEEVFKAQCSACHATGVAGSPKFQDAAAWGPRLAQGYEALLNSALKGKNAMPAQAGNYSDVEIGRAVVYMANAAGAKFAVPGPAASAAEAAAAPAETPAPAAPVAEAPAASAAMVASTEAPAKAMPAAAANPGAGKALYESVCMACHAAGVAGAPKFGDKAAWAPRLAAGMDEVYKIATQGKGAMPPKGGSTASDADFRAAVDYMVNAAK